MNNAGRIRQLLEWSNYLRDARPQALTSPGQLRGPADIQKFSVFITLAKGEFGTGHALPFSL